MTDNETPEKANNPSRKVHVAFDPASALHLAVISAHLRQMGAGAGAGAAVRYAVIAESKRILSAPNAERCAVAAEAKRLLNAPKPIQIV